MLGHVASDDIPWLGLPFLVFVFLARGDALRSAQRLPLATIFRAFGAVPVL
jgi:hypothetical protein